MPKIVDPASRRKEVFDALFAVIVEHGVSGVTLRRVAERAGLAIGSVRHYFDSHEEMLRSAAHEVMDRISARVRTHRDALADPDADRRLVVERMLGELLPTDERSTQETIVWLEFAIAARITPAFRETAEQLHTGLRSLTTRFFEQSGLVAPQRRGVEAERFAALVDGLAFGGALHPDRLDQELMVQVLRAHLTALGYREAAAESLDA